MTLVTYRCKKSTALIFEGMISFIRNVFVGRSVEKVQQMIKNCRSNPLFLNYEVATGCSQTKSKVTAQNQLTNARKEALFNHLAQK